MHKIPIFLCSSGLIQYYWIKRPRKKPKDGSWNSLPVAWSGTEPHTLNSEPAVNQNPLKYETVAPNIFRWVGGNLKMCLVLPHFHTTVLCISILVSHTSSDCTSVSVAPNTSWVVLNDNPWAGAAENVFIEIRTEKLPETVQSKNPFR